MVLAQLPGGLSPARPWPGRGAPARRPGRCHTAGHRGWCRRRSSPAARPAATGRPLGQARRAVPGPAPPHRRRGQVAVQDRVIKAPGGQPRLVLEAAQHLAREACATRPPGLPGICQPSAVTSMPTVTWWRRARASSQLSRASPATGGTRSGSVRRGAHEAAARGLPCRAGAADSRPAANAAASWRWACWRPHRSGTGSSSAAVRCSSPDRIVVTQPRVISVMNEPMCPLVRSNR